MGRVCGSEKKRKRNINKSPDCWTHELKQKPLEKLSREELYQRDIKSEYTVLHALCASGMDRVTLTCKFEFLSEKRLMGKIVAKNRKGNVPLQSALESKAVDEQTIELIVTYVPGAKKVMLENRNKYNETAIEQSLTLEHTDVFKLLLKECVSCGALKELTCIGKVNRCCSTLLHQCVQNRRVAHIRAYMEVCKEYGIKYDLCPLDEKGYTPWEYLMRYTKKEMLLVEEVFSILSVYEVSVGTLTVNKNRETMLHRAYRSNNAEFKVLLEGKYEVPCDGYKRKPSERNRIISSQKNAKSAHVRPQDSSSSDDSDSEHVTAKRMKKDQQPHSNPCHWTPGIELPAKKNQKMKSRNVLSPCQPPEGRMQFPNDSSSSDNEHVTAKRMKEDQQPHSNPCHWTPGITPLGLAKPDPLGPHPELPAKPPEIIQHNPKPFFACVT